MRPPLFHELEWINRFAVTPNLEVQVRRSRPSRVAGQADHLSSLNFVALRGQEP
jgi:hypothetical protein